MLHPEVLTQWQVQKKLLFVYLKLKDRFVISDLYIKSLLNKWSSPQLTTPYEGFFWESEQSTSN